MSTSKLVTVIGVVAALVYRGYLVLEGIKQPIQVCQVGKQPVNPVAATPTETKPTESHFGECVNESRCFRVNDKETKRCFPCHKESNEHLDRIQCVYQAVQADNIPSLIVQLVLAMVIVIAFVACSDPICRLVCIFATFISGTDLLLTPLYISITYSALLILGNPLVFIFRFTTREIDRDDDSQSTGLFSLSGSRRTRSINGRFADGKTG